MEIVLSIVLIFQALETAEIVLSIVLILVALVQIVEIEALFLAVILVR